MRIRHWTLLVGAVLCAACGSRHTNPAEPQPALTAGQIAEIEQSVREFAVLVAHDVTREGPAAWRRHFADTPSFFMAVDGHLQFANSAAATAGIQDLTRTIKQIELRWGDDLRVDPLTPHLAVMATSWQEVQVNADGGRVDANGFFTGLAERREGRWQFRNAHWSLARPAQDVGR